ncbi:MORN repeat-containing protein 1-like [Myripristis murdjan]|uniref:MORN repeat-containing protein 1-like n=1 Tax=Myripristis murdjan TaxID=586833 RepID=UPI0011763CC3|nr:MORN repeat-containing protein 1 [Myripristis murdjan]
MRLGFGRYVYANSFFRYEGEWNKGRKHGQGKLFMRDGSYYEGEFRHGEIEGNGYRYWATTGESYSGQFSEGELHGFGVMHKASGERYEGQFSYGQRDGHGSLVDKDGQTYEGSFYQNKRHGEGQMQYRNGDHYEGGWLLDQKQGHGVMHFGDGSLYEGQWRNSLFNGQGMMIHASGIIYEGLWMNGRPQGGASKMLIEGGDALEVFQESPFCVEVQLQTEEGEQITGESGRVLQISAGIRMPDLPPTSSASLLKMAKDIKESAIQTPFGFQVVSYPLMERAFESSRGPAAPPVLELAVVGAKSGSVAEAESSLLEGEWESGSRSDGPAHGGGGTATPSYLDGHVTGQEASYSPWPTRRTEQGQAKFQDLMLAPPPSDFIPFKMDDIEKKQTKKPTPGNSSDKSSRTQDNKQDRRPSVGSCLTSNSKKMAPEGRSVRPGEYVIMVKDVTSPPFLGQTIPVTFALLRVLPAKTSNSHADKTEKTKPEKIMSCPVDTGI